MITAFPLTWPEGWKRTTNRTVSKFETPFEKARKFLSNELKLLGATSVIISTNMPIRNDGMPHANLPNPTDPGAAVYFKYKGKGMSFACDKWRHLKCNIYSIGKTIEAIRGIQRWGASDMLERAFTGFQQLEAPKSTEWWEELGVEKNATASEIKQARRNKLAENHPDRGGDSKAFIRVTEAYAKAEELGLV